ncbi:MAG TPA: sn-glycerol-3-phosphate ABC transporter permease UgpA [Candidatus Sulfotelmatobacter sp.]|nr:sn-glycerol-3-phosphate ABC transporter permease UgpA [Candidatus Sulfotelmatobacter sp.]
MHKRVTFNNKLLPYLLLAPQLAVTLIFFVWPAFQAVEQSVLVQDAFGLSTKFVWLQNFKNLFADPNYLASFQVTVVFSIAVAGFGLAFALLLAAMADRVVRGATGYTTLLIWPYAVAPAVAGALWSFLFDPTVGEVTHLLGFFGINWNYLLNGNQALCLVVLAASWNQISYNFLFFLAGLQSIPRSLIEAAAIDGAGPGRRFWTIMFPLLSPTGFFLLTVNVVYAFFGTFGIIDIMTKGGPAQSTEILVYKVYSDSFRALDLGGSAAQSVILMFIVMVLTVVQFRYIERRVHY